MAVKRSSPRAASLFASAAVALLAGCGSSPSGSSTSGPQPGDANPPGDIPDNQAYVAYSPPAARFVVKVPEGWSRTMHSDTVTFTDKLNAVQVQSVRASAPPTPAVTRRTEIPRLAKSVPGFHVRHVTTVRRPAGRAVRITYLATATKNPVTGRGGQDAIERYTFFHRGRAVVLTLSGPRGADNVDPWRIISSSLRWTG